MLTFCSTEPNEVKSRVTSKAKKPFGWSFVFTVHDLSGK
jgi:hypothetical protein